MKGFNLHPNTQLFLEAWKRLDQPQFDKSAAPLTRNHPDLIEALFVIERNTDGLWVFRNAGRRVERVLGRVLHDHDFLPLWTGHDKTMISAFLDAVLENRLPGLIDAGGETLNGHAVDVELTFTPIGHNMRADGRHDRLLGLYQPVGDDAVLKGKPVWRHRLTALYPPVASRAAPVLRLVANNN